MILATKNGYIIESENHKERFNKGVLNSRLINDYIKEIKL